MDCLTLLAETLRDVIPVYENTPELNSEDDTNAYATITLTGRPAEHAEGRMCIREYMLSLVVYSPVFNFELYDKIRETLQSVGFSYYGEGETGNDTVYPYEKSYYIDFLYIQEVTSNG